MKYVIIGTGVAGIAAIEAIRSVDQSGEITLIGNDPHGFYSRPGLAYYLTGEIHDQALFSKQTDELKNLRFRYLQGHVKRVLRNHHCLEVDVQNNVPYDRLLLALGASAVSLDIPGSKLKGVLKLDYLSDAKQIVKLAKKGKTAIVVGGGITALELVEGLISRGMDVHYLLRGDRYWSGVLDFQESRIVEQRLRHDGVKMHYHSEIVEIIGKGNHVRFVHLKDGAVLNCDLLAYAIGVRPQSHLAKQSALNVDRGILVNEYMQTNDPDIFAAGDVAQVYDPRLKRSVIESLWGPAREQGNIAGLNMAGQKRIYVKSAPFNVTRLAGLTTTIIGTVGRGRDEDLVGIARGDSETWRQLPDTIAAQSGFDVNRLRVMVGKRTLVGAIVMGDQTLSSPLEEIISKGLDISSIRRDLLAPNANVSDVLAMFWSNSVERGVDTLQRTIPRDPLSLRSIPTPPPAYVSLEEKTVPRNTFFSQRSVSG